MSKQQQPIFSLCHTTARLPEGWREAAQAWYDNCDNPKNVEHILTTDEVIEYEKIFPKTVYAVNHGPKTCVAGWNLAARISEGKFIINIADDWFPCPHWDTELLKLIDFDKQQVLEVNTGGHQGLLTFCLVTRSYYERYGYLLHPGYIGVYSDNDFTDTARRDGVVTDAQHLLFEHRHPLLNPNVAADAVHLNQSRTEAWEVGRKLYVERSKAAGARVKPRLAICLPGEKFSSHWVLNWTQMLSGLMGQADLAPVFGFSSNVYVTRACMAHDVMHQKPTPDYVLWMDDDNILTYYQLAMLMDDLDKYPEIDSVSAWTWCQLDVLTSPPRVSAGLFGEKGACVALRHEAMMKGDDYVKHIEWTGFPAVLMRYRLLEMVGGPDAFQPYKAPPGHPYGFYGEDTSFCRRAQDVGARLAVDRRVKIPHLKLRAAEPIIPDTMVKHDELMEAVA